MTKQAMYNEITIFGSDAVLFGR